MNRYVWNFREEGPAEVPGLYILELASGAGPLVAPGKYQVKLIVGGKENSAPLEIKADPRVRIGQSDFDKQYELAEKIRDGISELHNAVNEMRSERSILEVKRKMANPSKAQAIEATEQQMVEIEGRIVQVASVNRFAALVDPIMLDADYANLGNAVEGADSAPTAQEYDAFQQYEKEREDLLGRWKSLKSEISQIKNP
jgi:hypothetical protein